MWPDQVLKPGPLALESDVLQTALRSPATVEKISAFSGNQTRDSYRSPGQCLPDFAIGASKDGKEFSMLQPILQVETI